MDALLSFLLLFIILAMISVLGTFLLFFARQAKVQKFAFYLMIGVGFLVTFLNIERLSHEYFTLYPVPWIIGTLTVLSFTIEIMGKFHYKFTLAKSLVSLSVIVGVASLFLL